MLTVAVFSGCTIMASHLFRQLVSSLTRPVAQMNWMTRTSPPAAGAFRCAYATSTAASARVVSVRPASIGSPALCTPSLLGRCQLLSCIQPSAGMKTKSALKRRCKDCFFVRRRGRLFVFCKTNPRHKQRQG